MLKYEYDMKQYCINLCILWPNVLLVVGARCVATLLHEMKRQGRDCRFGVISMCIGILSFLLSLSGIFLEYMINLEFLECRYRDGGSGCF